MSRYIILFSALLLLGCQKKQMQLPQVQDTKITSVEDYSQVYISYEETSEEAKLNANGLISSTNWVLHVDKRNKLKEVAPLFIKLQEKRTNPRNPHSNPDAHLYISLADIPHKRLGFMDVTELNLLPYDPQKMSEYGNTPIYVYPDGFRLKEDNGEKTPWNKFGVYKNVFYVWIFSGDMTFQQFVDIYYTRLHQQTDRTITQIMIND
ncbi:hypothetical protein HMPREF1551_00628 [Capnocytophaga sp. oral taxon 863 str. F0517]|uniref:hypothetical protein n=1 Tax=Capnocytophaga sp. oral taxon 863 TaxID=1227265 RepID=UPI000396859F|nr:hypothetical protein [Capnocytophaga sp. oral taxon 863]ERI64183.1 hypothetical protein HMPREF1551_00628 [Capnocytophaga sp. oral taxon 863 str. F0517]